MKRRKSETARLRERITHYRRELEDEKARHEKTRVDRSEFRAFFVEELRRQIEANGRSQYYAAATMIERLSRFLGKVESWYWG